MRRALTTCLLVLILSSGCLGIGLKDNASPAVKQPVPAADVVTPQMLKVRELLKDVPCEATVSASGTSANLKQVGQFRILNPLFPGSTPGQLDTFRNRTVLAHPNAPYVAVLNTTDPARPVMWYSVAPLFVGGNILEPRNLLPYANAWDVRVTASGANLLASFNHRIYAYDLGGRFARAGPGGWLDIPPDFGGQPQRLATATIGGRDYLFVAPGQSGTGLLVARVAGEGLYARIDNLGVVNGPDGQAASRITLQPYDMHIETEYVNGENHTIMYAANGVHGILILDVSEPTKPQLVANLAPGAPGPTNAPSVYNSVHVAHVEGRRLLVGNVNGPQSSLRVWDITEFKSPKQLGAWTLDPGRPMMPQSEIALVNTTLLVAHHNQGLWGFDLARLLQSPKDGLKPILHWQPPAGGTTYDVSVEDGLIHVSDAVNQSVQILGHGCFPAGDKRLTSAG